MGTVTISATDYPIYGTLAGANEYLAASLNAATWSAATSDRKAQCLVSATRLIKAYLDSRGIATDPETSTAEQLAHATYELALLLLQNPALANSVMSATGAKKRVKAGSAEVEYAVNVRQVTKAHGFPDAVFALIGAWIAAQSSSSGVGFAFSSGTCEASTLLRNGSQPIAGGD